MRDKIIRLSQLINRNTGFFVATAIVFFGIAIVNFQRDNLQILRDTRSAVENTETIVSKQDETLEAIKKTATDNKLLSDEKTNIIICMLQVPVELRTTNTVEDCEKQSVEQAPQPAEVAPGTQEQPSTPQAQQRPQTPPSEPQETPKDEGLIPDSIPILGGLL